MAPDKLEDHTSQIHSAAFDIGYLKALKYAKSVLGNCEGDIDFALFTINNTIKDLEQGEGCNAKN